MDQKEMNVLKWRKRENCQKPRKDSTKLMKGGLLEVSVLNIQDYHRREIQLRARRGKVFRVPSPAVLSSATCRDTASNATALENFTTLGIAGNTLPPAWLVPGL
jgi:hypothetical protein